MTIIHGANLNLLGTREPSIYGNESLDQINEYITNYFPTIEFIFFQSNIEGELINKIQEAANTSNAIIINPGAYSHTSVAIADAIAAIKIPTVEVHLSNIFARESFRHTSITGSKCLGTISGFGKYSYILGIEAVINYITKGSGLSSV
ncbi:MAG: type II 3-dehydroquinate dehydratase [Bacteroidales bacterium]